ncbi:MAG: twin-arginine translocase subunit TatC [Acidimicrobiales bacterium]
MADTEADVLAVSGIGTAGSLRDGDLSPGRRRLAVPERFRRNRNDPAEQGRMSLLDHLAELRRRVIISTIAIFIGAIVVYVFYDSVIGFLEHPYCHVLHTNPATRLQPCQLVVLDPIEKLTIRLKVAFFGGLGVALPVVLWQVWRFITPGLHKHEKRYAIPFVFASMLFFALGAAVALLTFPLALDFFQSVGGKGIGTFYAFGPYLRLIMLMIVAYGVAFEFPVLLIALQLAHIVTSAKLRAWRRGAIVTVTVFSAVFTPSSDPVSMFAMAIPMYIFYEGSIVAGRLLKR